MFKKLSTWVFVPIGALVAWGVNGQPLGMAVLVVVLFGLSCVMMGCWMSVAHTESRHKQQADALEELRGQYANAMRSQLVNMRQALLILATKALKSAASKLVEDLLVNFDNQEQFDAAVNHATAIVEEELKEISDLVGIEKVK